MTYLSNLTTRARFILAVAACKQFAATSPGRVNTTRLPSHHSRSADCHAEVPRLPSDFRVPIKTDRINMLFSGVSVYPALQSAVLWNSNQYNVVQYSTALLNTTCAQCKSRHKHRNVLAGLKWTLTGANMYFCCVCLSRSQQVMQQRMTQGIQQW